ncbi:hypothetical protein [Streptomyces sp. NBC_00425]|uniref:hypothetical protein n=1 Tax=Streptomyces sp. NBC_00425 TaxID=2975740 RepID=UPI002E1A73CC
MALRGGPPRRLQNNPLGGILRDLDRRSRTTTRRKKPAPPEAIEGPRGPRGPRGEQGPPAVPSAGSVVETGDDGRAVWAYPERYEEAPVLTAVAMSERPAVVVLEDVQEGFAVVRVWQVRPDPVSGLACPVGSGVRVHVTARPARASG